MKKFEIKPFREFWQDCFNCIVYSMTDYAFDVPKLYYYNNMYFYRITDETAHDDGKAIQYKSFTPWTDNFRLIDEITKNREIQNWEDEHDIIGYVKKNLDNDRLVLAGVDLYYWIKDGLHYHHNHIDHMSLIIGYDDDVKEMTILETGDDMYAEFTVTYDCVIEAIEHCSIPTRSFEIDRDAVVKLFDRDDLVYYAKNIVASIEDIVNRKDEFWRVEGVSDDGLYEVISILQTHIFSMQNRAKIDAYMFKNAFKSDVIGDRSLNEEFSNIASKFEGLKGRCIKLLYRNNRIEQILKIKDEVFELLQSDKKIWELFIDNCDKIEMETR